MKPSVESGRKGTTFCSSSRFIDLLNLHDSGDGVPHFFSRRTIRLGLLQGPVKWRFLMSKLPRVRSAQKNEGVRPLAFIQEIDQQLALRRSPEPGVVVHGSDAALIPPARGGEIPDG